MDRLQIIFDSMTVAIAVWGLLWLVVQRLLARTPARRMLRFSRSGCLDVVASTSRPIDSRARRRQGMADGNWRSAGHGGCIEGPLPLFPK
jgi:hypothetical protein